MTLTSRPTQASAATSASSAEFLHFQRTPLARALQGALICLSLGFALGVDGRPVLAQESGRPVPVVESGSYSIPSGPLDAAVLRFAREAGINLTYDAALLQGRHSPGLSGRYEAEAGLAALLAGSGIEAQARAGGGYALRPIRQMGRGNTQMLDAVTVQGVADGTTDGTGSYTATGPSRTATGLEMTLRETPQSVTVMTRQRMDDFKLETLTDVMEQTPGVTVTRQNDMATFNVRGSKVNLQTDGNRRYSNGWGWNSHIVHSFDDMAEIDRVEVLKGSSGLINGDGAYGATVNLIRKRPTREFQASVTAGAGNWDTYRADADVSGPLNADTSLRGRLVASRRDAKTFNGKNTDSSMVYGTLEYDLTPDTVLSAGLTWREREVRGAGGTTPIQGFDGKGNAVPLMPRDFNIGADWAGYRQHSLNAFARLEHRFANGWTGKLQVAHEGIQTPNMRIGSLRYAVPVTAQYGLYKDIKSRDQSVMLDLQGPFELFGQEHQLLFGVGASRHRTTLLRSSQPDEVLNGADFSQGGSIVPQPADNQVYSDDYFSNDRWYAYTAGRFSLADPVKLIVGARVTDYRQKDVTDVGWYNYDLHEKAVVTPYAGLVIDVAQDVSVYASYASIFQAQSAKDIDDRTLDPEEGITYEVGAKGEFFDRRLNASASYFWMRTDNTAEVAGMNARGEEYYTAVSGAIRKGYELELSGEVARGWQVQGSYVQNSSDLNSASTTPKHQFKLGTTYQFGDGSLRGLTVGAATRWQSAISVQRGMAELRQEAYWLLDLMARYQVNDRLSIHANLNNALDKKYFAGVTNFNAQGLFYTWGAPRSINVSMRYEF